MSVPTKFFAIFDPVAHAVRIDGGFILGEYSNREGALRAAKAQGWKLPASGNSSAGSLEFNHFNGLASQPSRFPAACQHQVSTRRKTSRCPVGPSRTLMSPCMSPVTPRTMAEAQSDP